MSTIQYGAVIVVCKLKVNSDMCITSDIFNVSSQHAGQPQQHDPTSTLNAVSPHLYRLFWKSDNNFLLNVHAVPAAFYLGCWRCLVFKTATRR